MYFIIDFDGHVNYETNSIVYKYVEDYFMPFQSFKLDYIQEWLPAVVSENIVIFSLLKKNIVYKTKMIN